MTTRQANERLVGDLKAVARDAEDLIRATAGEAGAGFQEARNRLSGVLDSARATYSRFQDKTALAGQATDRYIRERPYQWLGVALGVGLILGILFRRR